MRTGLNIDDELLERARELTGVAEVDELIQLGLRTLVEREPARRLALLGGSMPRLKIVSRRRGAAR